MYRNGPLRNAWRFYGKAYVHESGVVKEQVMHKTIDAKLDRDIDRKWSAVVVTVNRITSRPGEFLQEITS